MASASAQRASSPVGQAHTPDLSRFYRFHLPPVHPGEFEFHLDLLRPRQPAFPLDRLVDTLNWVDEQTVLTGSLTAHRPDVEDPSSLPLARRQLVRCRVRWAGGMYELWTMRTEAPQIQKDQNTVTVPLKDDMILLDGGERDWLFRATKQHPQGYMLEEVVQTVADRLGLKVRECARGSKRMAFVKRGVSGLDVLRAACSKEQQFSGRGFIIRLRNAELEVVTIRRNPVVYRFAEQIQSALITQKTGSTAPITALTGRAHIGSGRGAQKITYTAYDRRVIRLLGYVHDEQDYGRVASHKELRDNVNRDLAKGLRLNDTVTITHQGVPFVQRGDGAQIWLPGEGYAGEQSWVYCTRANHTVQAGIYTTDFDFNVSDPFLAELTAEAKAAAARAKKKGHA